MKIKPLQVLITFFAAGIIFSQITQAVNPPPDGGYPGFNTAEGQNALFGLTTGVANTAVGWSSLKSNTDGSFNTGVGAGTLFFNIGNQDTGEGIENTAIGAGALLFNTTGASNTANGAFALFSNTTGGANTAVGREALSNNTTGGNNTAVGRTALVSNTMGVQNTAAGGQALFHNTTGFFNTGFGFTVLISNTTGSGNTAIGEAALDHNESGSNNTAVGRSAGAVITGSGNVCIGADIIGEAGVNDSTYIRNVNTTVQSGGGFDAVTVRLSDGRLGHAVSSHRYKDDIQPMDKASERLFALKPVTYRYKKEIDQSQSLDYGLIAEEVARIDPNLAVRDGEGKISNYRRDAINAMLLNEFLKEHRTVLELKEQIAALTATVKEQAARIENVSAAVRDNRSVSQIVFNTP